MKNPDKLRVSPAAEELAVSVYEFTAAFPAEERYGLAAQMRRAAISVGSNIFEGCGRTTDRGFRASLGVAHAEASELAFQVRVALRLSFGHASRGEELKAEIENVRRMIFNLMQRLSP